MAVPAVGQVAQQAGLYQVQVFLRHQRITLEEEALPVDDGKTSADGDGCGSVGGLDVLGIGALP